MNDRLTQDARFAAWVAGSGHPGTSTAGRTPTGVDKYQQEAIAEAQAVSLDDEPQVDAAGTYEG
jgi:hypothetical protein